VAAPRQQVRLPARPRARVSLERDDARFEVTAFSKIAARDASRDAIGAPRCADSARRDAPIASSDQTSIDRRRVIARSRRRASATRRLRTRDALFFLLAPLLSAEGLSDPALERVPFRARGGRGRLDAGPSAGGTNPGDHQPHTAARMSETTARRLPRARCSPGFLALRKSRNVARTKADRGFFPSAIAPFRRTRTASRSIPERVADPDRFTALPLQVLRDFLLPPPPVGPGDRPPGAVPPQQRLDSLHRVRVRREGVLRLPRLDRH